MRERTETVDGVTVYFDSGAEMSKASPDAPVYPYYCIRGKQITEQQAFEVIRHTDSFFIFDQNVDFNDIFPDNHTVFPMHWFEEDGCDAGFGWIHPDGIVGINHHLASSACMENIIKEIAWYAKKFPFLDFVIALTKWEVRCPGHWILRSEILDSAEHDPECYDEEPGTEPKHSYKTLKKLTELEFEDIERRDFEKVLYYGIWLHDGIIEVMSAERTVGVYMEYEQLYEEEDKRVYVKNYYNLFQPDIVNMDYFYKCLEAFGIDDPAGYADANCWEGMIETLENRSRPENKKAGLLHEDDGRGYVPEKKVNGIKVYIDKGVDTYFEMFARHPYYRLRGKPVTERQAFDIITLSDSFFRHYLDMHTIGFEFPMKWFPAANYFPYGFGWVRPDGVVGINYFTSKYPTLDELIDECTVYLKRFPFLDFIMGITSWDEMCQERWDMYFNDKEKYKRSELIDLERKDFESVLDSGIWVHDGIIEVMGPERTAEMYRRYEELYEAEDKRIYIQEYYEKIQTDAVGKEYLLKCLSARGIGDPEKYLLKKLPEHELKFLIKHGYSFDKYK